MFKIIVLSCIAVQTLLAVEIYNSGSLGGGSTDNVNLTYDGAIADNYLSFSHGTKFLFNKDFYAKVRLELYNYFTEEQNSSYNLQSAFDKSYYWFGNWVTDIGAAAFYQRYPHGSDPETTSTFDSMGGEVTFGNTYQGEQHAPYVVIASSGQNYIEVDDRFDLELSLALGDDHYLSDYLFLNYDITIGFVDSSDSYYSNNSFSCSFSGEYLFSANLSLNALISVERTSYPNRTISSSGMVMGSQKQNQRLLNAMRPNRDSSDSIFSLQSNEEFQNLIKLGGGFAYKITEFLDGEFDLSATSNSSNTQTERYSALELSGRLAYRF
ncbi:MAG: hypothetical protein A2504_01460 [Bdellovibrionales bacterium RIFOXYD12_FULL_39_22]|nr:MAG: hypothetical protein A2385_02350 [Bdellovibrionales bacterium RIFOXYB1_FULL_39_21]OFZ42774.1 MAG: hypothetical protein A2485_10535 [Bdellovibrionales bacterium RIFOXYC12_FULL_39_17]OFZ47333.1 MAG: hypothetical protein A2404_15140 [Bdellovibrionales bacterium RIFOXYC1_FULL_39_130]OFZ73211.1 MAG: hypothetical protein A2451_16735 [Bdellovibrionales bacterium RIFOXYC2_FULL_39_8]OFZ75499.1 MAG: hypothetical protein A2560_04410 [Bdellovibrionales bacterium RIFOXYD1_FULL_39_84]OFZ93453.1 MAG: